jgi:predicted signal transduction protein with EAL and GGDEF domain
MTYQTVEKLADEKAVKAKVVQLSSGGNPFSFYCINFTDSSNLRGSDRSYVNDKLLVNVANLLVAMLGTKMFIAKTNKDRLEVILPGIDKPNAITNAGEMREKLEEQFCSKMPGLGIAMGVANHPTDTDEKLGIRHLATVGADEATKLGQNRIFAAISKAERAKDE